MVAVVGHLAGELSDMGEVRLDSVEPTGIGRREHRFHVAGSHQIGQEQGFVTAEVIHDHVEPNGVGVAGPQLLENLQDVGGGLALMDLAHQAFGVDIVESQQLLGALKPTVGGPEALGVVAAAPSASVPRTQFQRTAFVEADYGASCGRRVVEVQDAVF